MTIKKITFKPFPLERQIPGKPRFMYADGLKQDERIRLMASEASDSGRCWWVYKFLINNPLYGKKR